RAVALPDCTGINGLRRRGWEMGLAMEVGALAYLIANDSEAAGWVRKNFELINQLLAANGLPLHHEPESLPKMPYRGCLRSFPYSDLHYLRRVVAYSRRAPNKLTPLGEDEDPKEDPELDREYDRSESHVVCHSDCEGYYVPIDFARPLYDGKEVRILGAILGSCQQALQELIQVAPLLGIKLTRGGK